MEPAASTPKMLARNEAGIGWMTFNIPERRNAVSMEMWQAAESILADFAEDPAVRVIVLSGAGQAFVSGADVAKFESGRSPAEAVVAYNAQTERLPGPFLAVQRSDTANAARRGNPGRPAGVA